MDIRAAAAGYIISLLGCSRVQRFLPIPDRVLAPDVPRSMRKQARSDRNLLGSCHTKIRSTADRGYLVTLLLVGEMGHVRAELVTTNMS